MNLNARIITKRCADPLPNEIAIQRWLDRMRVHEADLPGDQLREIPEGYVKPYPSAGSVAKKNTS